MIIFQNLKAAKEMGLARAWAINRRQQYLTEALMDLEDGEDSLCSVVESSGFENALSRYIASGLLIDHLNKKTQIIRELEVIKKITTDPRDTITDDMIERARQYPIERLIEFHRRKATAWCHEDKTPSLVHLDRTNRAWCPVCDLKWDAISYLMERQGLSFPQAVKELAG